MHNWKCAVGCVFVFGVTNTSADVELMQHDSYLPGDSVTYHSNFQPGEIAAARFIPDMQCPCLVTDVELVYAGTADTRNIGIKIWEDPEGNLDPDELLIHDFTTLAASDSSVQSIDMRSNSVVVQGPFRVGIQFLNTGLPAIVTDTDGTIDAGANFVLKNTGTFDWTPAVSQNMSGDFVIRATIDNAVLADVDNDGFANEVDNCVERSNASQRDTDNDLIGNFCDPDVAIPNDCVVNFLDFAVYRENFEMTGDLDTDNNGDGVTNFIDFAMFVNYFLGSPGPSAEGCD